MCSNFHTSARIANMHLHITSFTLIWHMWLKYFVEKQVPRVNAMAAGGLATQQAIDQVVPVYSTSILEGLYSVTEDPALVEKLFVQGQVIKFWRFKPSCTVAVFPTNVPYRILYSYAVWHMIWHYFQILSVNTHHFPCDEVPQMVSFRSGVPRSLYERCIATGVATVTSQWYEPLLFMICARIWEKNSWERDFMSQQIRTQRRSWLLFKERCAWFNWD